MSLRSCQGLYHLSSPDVTARVYLPTPHDCFHKQASNPPPPLKQSKAHFRMRIVVYVTFQPTRFTPGPYCYCPACALTLRAGAPHVFTFTHRSYVPKAVAEKGEPSRQEV